MERGKIEAATVAATAADAVHRIEIVSGRRRRHDASFRALVVADSLVAGVQVREVAQRNGVCPSLVYRWRRMAGSAPETVTPGFLPVRITEERVAAPPAAPVPPRVPSVIEIELSNGARVRVDETVSLAALRRVLGALRR
ncbi:MAG TPA: transposase [Acetobacteraceae bacterium]|nr:transposase [Acetobacteraceae bacterium]